jgi:hypothetical protein
MQPKRRTGVGLHGLGSCWRDGQGVGDVLRQQLQEIGHAGDPPLSIGVARASCSASVCAKRASLARESLASMGKRWASVVCASITTTKSPFGERQARLTRAAWCPGLDSPGQTRSDDNFSINV